MMNLNLFGRQFLKFMYTIDSFVYKATTTMNTVTCQVCTLTLRFPQLDFLQQKQPVPSYRIDKV